MKIGSNVGPQIDPKDIDSLEVQRGSYAADEGDRTYGVFNVLPRNGFERNREGRAARDRRQPRIPAKRSFRSAITPTPLHGMPASPVRGRIMDCRRRCPTSITTRPTQAADFLSLIRNQTAERSVAPYRAVSAGLFPGSLRPQSSTTGSRPASTTSPSACATRRTSATPS